jgi:zinc protease
MYGAGLAIGESIDDIRLWPQRIAAITADQVKAVAVEIFDRRRSVTGLLVKDATP